MGAQPATLMSRAASPATASTDTPRRPSPSPSPAAGRDRRQRRAGHRHRHRDRRRRRSGRGRRGLHRRRRHLAPGHRHDRRGPTASTPAGAGTATIRVRAIDDSANIGHAGHPVRSPLTGPSSLFGAPGAGRRRRPTTTSARRARRAVHPARPTASSPASASTRAPATPARTPAPCGRRAARAGHRHLHQRDGHRLADADLRPAGPGQRRHDLRRVLLRAERALRGRPVLLLLPRSRAPPLVAPARRQRRCTPAVRNFPHRTHQSTNYHVDVLFLDRNVIPPAIRRSPRPAAPPASRPR